MTPARSITLLLPLGKQNMARLVAEAERIGVAPEDYARGLIEEGLALQRQAGSMSLAQIMRSVRRTAGSVSESEIVDLVNRARSDQHGRQGKVRSTRFSRRYTGSAAVFTHP